MRKKLLVGLTTVLFLFGIVCGAKAALVQWSSSIGGNDHWYEIVDSGKNGAWINAENNAIARGGHLVTINDAEEEAWLRSTFGTKIRYWIGFTDSASEGNWVWVSGESATYTHWDVGQPDNGTPPDYGEDFAVLNWNRDNGAWNDWDYLRYDYQKIDGIAEYNPVPIPGAVWLLGSGLVGFIALKRKKTDLNLV